MVDGDETCMVKEEKICPVGTCPGGRCVITIIFFVEPFPQETCTINGPNAKTIKVFQPKCKVQGRGVQGKGVKEGDKNPKALERTEDEELGGIVLRPVKPRILPKLQHSLHNDQAELCCPNTHQT